MLYLSDDPDPVTAWPGKDLHLGRGFGQFKPEASGLLVEQLPHLKAETPAWGGVPQYVRVRRRRDRGCALLYGCAIDAIEQLRP